MQTTPLYNIKWYDTQRGTSGKGTKPFDHDAAIALCNELNTEHPNIQHVPSPCLETLPESSKPSV